MKEAPELIQVCVGGDGGGDAVATANAAVCVGGGVQTKVTDGGEGGGGADPSFGGDGVGDAVWPLPMVLSVSVAADGCN